MTATTEHAHDAPPMIDFTPRDELGRRLLLTPGPVTTSPAVREAAMLDVGSWDADTTQAVRTCQRVLLDVVCNGRDDLACTLIPGSGTYAVESMLGSAVGRPGRLLILSNGLYGERLMDIARQIGVNYGIVRVPEDRSHDPELVAQELAKGGYTHLATCHVETTAGVVHDLNAIGDVCKAHGVRMLVDAMASFCGYEVGPGKAIDFDRAPIDHIVASANKCAQGIPGMSYVVSRREAVDNAVSPSHSMSLDLRAQWRLMEDTGRFRYTPPTHVLLSMERALLELEAEGVAARAERYKANQRTAIDRLTSYGCHVYIADEYRSHINTTFLYPTADFETFFNDFKSRLRAEGYIIFPQQVTKAEAFRVGAIGHIGPAEVHGFCDAVGRVLGKA
ncbi:MAG: 2-aminoethylphosphonate--pyruvate transaminase [Planctomycetota bacterium]